METIQHNQQHKTKPELAVFLNARPEIGVSVEDGVVTLTGTVDSHAKRTSARDAVAGVMGVKAIINNIKVSNSVVYNRKDSEIAEAILSAIQLSTAFGSDRNGQEREMDYWEIFA